MPNSMPSSGSFLPPVPGTEQANAPSIKSLPQGVTWETVAKLNWPRDIQGFPLEVNPTTGETFTQALSRTTGIPFTAQDGQVMPTGTTQTGGAPQQMSPITGQPRSAFSQALHEQMAGWMPGQGPHPLQPKPGFQIRFPWTPADAQGQFINDPPPGGGMGSSTPNISSGPPPVPGMPTSGAGQPPIPGAPPPMPPGAGGMDPMQALKMVAPQSADRMMRNGGMQPPMTPQFNQPGFASPNSPAMGRMKRKGM